jgi:dihydrofolate synthase/folylpolyglutamate synthase
MHPNPDIRALLERLHHPSLTEITLGLERVQTLLNALGNPEKKLPPVIHVAGTNGKGSVCAYLTAIFQHAGLTVHRYTSPHLVRFNERILLADTQINDNDLQRYLEQIAALANAHPATFFEYTTAAAFLGFAETEADVCILETGMGGRLDATNIIPNPLLTIITPISMDHMDFLGNTLEKIAAEKAGIMKDGVPCIIAPQPPNALHILKETARSENTPLRVYGEDWHIINSHYVSSSHHFRLAPSLLGAHQITNAATAIAAVEKVASIKTDWNITKANMDSGLTNAVWPARLQRLKTPHPFALALPKASLWLDGGHNLDAAQALKTWLADQPKPRTIVCGMLADKDAEGFIHTLGGVYEIFIGIEFQTEKPIHTKEKLLELASVKGAHTKSALNVATAFELLAESNTQGTVLICGSLYLAGDVLSLSDT